MYVGMPYELYVCIPLVFTHVHANMCVTHVCMPVCSYSVEVKELHEFSESEEPLRNILSGDLQIPQSHRLGRVQYVRTCSRVSVNHLYRTTVHVYVCTYLCRY